MAAETITSEAYCRGHRSTRDGAKRRAASVPVAGWPVAFSSRVALAHVGADLRVPVRVRPGLVVDLGFGVDPDDRGAWATSLRFGVRAKLDRCVRRREMGIAV